MKITLKRQQQTCSATQYKLHNKVGVFFSKQQKTIGLQQENKEIGQRLETILRQYEQKNRQLKIISHQNQNLKDQINLNQIQRVIYENDIIHFRQLLVQIDLYNERLIQEQTFLDQQVWTSQKIIFEANNKIQDQTNLLNRYQEQKKIQRVNKYNGHNLQRVEQSILKSVQNLQKNVQVLSNKLQSKKKYLILLQKQKNKQDQQQKSKNLINPKKQKDNTYFLNSLSPRKYNKEKQEVALLTKQQKVQKLKIVKQKTKKYDDLNRKKNAILQKKK